MGFQQKLRSFFLPVLHFLGMDTSQAQPQQGLSITSHRWLQNLELPVTIQFYCESLLLKMDQSDDISYLRVQSLALMKSNKGVQHEYVAATVVAADQPLDSTDCACLVFERYSTREHGLKQATANASGSGPKSPTWDPGVASEQSASHTPIRSPEATVGDALGELNIGHSSQSSFSSSSPPPKLAHKIRNIFYRPVHGSFDASAESLDSSSSKFHPFRAGDRVHLLDSSKMGSKCADDTQVGLLIFDDPNSPLYFYQLAFIALAVSEKQPHYSTKFHCYWFVGMTAFVLERVKRLHLPESPQRGKTPFLNWKAMPKPEDPTIIHELVQDYEKRDSDFVAEFKRKKEQAIEAALNATKATEVDGLKRQNQELKRKAAEAERQAAEAKELKMKNKVLEEQLVEGDGWKTKAKELQAEVEELRKNAAVGGSSAFD